MKTNRFAAAILVIGAVSAQAAPVLAKTGKGVGVITALDPHAAKLTIEHGAIPAVGWPAMTMTFAATPPPCSRIYTSGRKSASTSASRAWLRR
jgi:Cu(I)/Ag(I) efflux system protein CusF